MTSTCSADGAALPRDKRRARKLKTVTFSKDDLIQGLVSRKRFEEEIERLIGILDAADPDPDLEETGDLEPSLGAYRPGDHYDGELDPSEHEPSLGSLTSNGGDQRGWSLGAADDREEEHNGREPEVAEPSLGSFDRMIDQSNWSRTTDGAACTGEDAELDDADREYSAGEGRPGPDDPSFPRQPRDPAIAEAEADAGRQLDELAMRMAGLGRQRPRPDNSICNVSQLRFIGEIRP